MYRAGKGRAATKRRLALGAFPAVTADQARALARERLAQITLGEDPAATLREEKGTRSLAAVLEQFFTEHVEPKLKPGTVRNYRQQAEGHILPELGRLKITEVTARHVSRLHHKLQATPYQANRVLALLSKFFNWCEITGYRDRGSMGRQEVEALGASIARMEACGDLSPVVAAVFKVLLFTGARSGEVTTLKWSYLDLEHGLAHLPDSKTGAKTIHLPAAAREVLDALPRINEYCFPGKYERGHIHDLRHAFASYAANSGQALPIIGKMLGHSQAATTARYAHVAENPVARAAEETARQIQKDLSAGTILPSGKTTG